MRTRLKLINGDIYERDIRDSFISCKTPQEHKKGIVKAYWDNLGIEFYPQDKKLIYNSQSDEIVSDRKIIGGNPTGHIELTNIKFQWAYNLWKLMLSKTWFPEEVSMAEDKKSYESLTPYEKNLYDLVLSQLVFMDSIQVNNLVDNINPYITAPEINICLVTQAHFEAIHSSSYAVMVESISENTSEIYDKWRTDKELFNKNERIANIYKNLSEKPTIDNIILSLVANLCLEGIFFYSGFALMFSFARFGKMMNSKQMIAFIKQDEELHTALFKNIIKEVFKEYQHKRKELEDKIYDIFKMSVEVETDWGKYLTKNEINGLNDTLIDLFIKYLADGLLKDIGFKPLYGVDTNPISWFDDFSKVNGAKSNHFENKGAGYSKGLDFEDF